MLSGPTLGTHYSTEVWCWIYVHSADEV